jgi:hypothetical protein
MWSGYAIPGAAGATSGDQSDVALHRGQTGISLGMSQNEEAERRVSDELANQPKQNGPGTEESKEKRADAEKMLRDKKTTK